MKILKRFLISLIIIIAIIGVGIIGGYIYIRTAFGIDLFNTIGQLKTLSQKVDEITLCPNAFSLDDMDALKKNIDTKINGLIAYEEGKGYEGYSVDFSALASSTPFTDDISLSSKQAGALAQTIYYEQTGGKVQIGGKELPTQLVQMDFLNISDNGSADFNVIAKVGFTPFKDDMKDFPLNLLKKYVPDDLYVSSTVRIDKTNEEMAYTISHKELRLNNLSGEDTADFFHTLDTVLKIGSAETMNMQIGSTAVNSLIGDNEHTGFVYSLKALGKTDFKFSLIEETSYLIIH